ncbi:hypothetical protein AL755_03460 (plasmid) [Arthrobacter sp. ERGS1:01]|uniref:hypothetical protein n=1 Tax=Arthrobacter sp. ERGS1:01 TaxID=1704044 RepID=UPI0006B6074E|nr:hypothetical protein [Arthrobacter sp. ERGS1:01]ALE04757.1 hypothetical protein AL755_03460 [Arthrobacter sp. ERGS1:01]
MSATEMVVRAIALALPTHQRARYREQWLADVRDAAEVGIPHGQIVRGALGFAAGSLTKSLVRTELRASFSWIQVGVVAALLSIFLYVVFPDSALLGGKKVALRDNYDVFATLMNTPFTMLAPVFVVFLSCSRFAQEIGNRFVSSARSRVRTESYVFAKLLVASGTAFLVFFAWTFLAFAVAFVLWPKLGNPSLDPAGYGLTASGAVLDSFGRTTYSQLLQSGTWTYALAYSAWVGFAAATYAALGMASLLVIKRRAVAMCVPFLVFFVQSAAAQLIGAPNLGLNFSMFPFGLQQQSILMGAAPTIVLAAMTGLIWLVLSRRLVRLENLA